MLRSIPFLLLLVLSIPAAQAAQYPLLAPHEDGSLNFQEFNISNKIVYHHQRMIGDAEVENDRILYHFDQQSHRLLAVYRDWRNDLPDELPQLAMNATVASYMTNGIIHFTKLIYISPESAIYRFNPVPTNPCWVIAHQETEHMELSVYDAVTGEFVGKGIAPPSESYSLTGPIYEDPCSDSWDAWASNARNWFQTMGYTCDFQEWPATQDVEDHIASTDVALFYELAHGGSVSFKHNCGAVTTPYAVDTYINDYLKMPFTFLGSCDGMCNTGSSTLSNSFRKGSMENTVTIGYCGMSTSNCSSCWGQSINWQTALFDYLSQGYTSLEAYDHANAMYPVCTASTYCMRIAGDGDLHLVPKITRGDLDPNWLSYQISPLGDDGPGRSVTWADFDGDGLQDIYLTRYNAANIVMKNSGDITFFNHPTGAAGDTGPASGAVTGDWDNDGDCDLYLVNDGADNLLMENQNGIFVTPISGDESDSGPGRAAAWADYDNDGLVDLYVANYGTPNLLLHNSGTGFTNVATGILADADNSTACAWADFDNDGDQDLCVVNDGAPNRLLRNDGGLFVDIAGGPTADSGPGRAAAWADYDMDGDLDLCIANAGQPDLLLRNDDGVFTDTGALLAWTTDSRDIAWADYDNDGDPDLCVSCYGQANLLLENNGGVFTDIASGPMADVNTGTGIAWGDYNNDGRQDIYQAEDNSYNQLLRNVNGSGNHWLKFQLEGVQSNRAAIGARLSLHVGSSVILREISGGSGACSQNSLIAGFGIGTAMQADSLIVDWPSGIRQVLRDINADQQVWVLEQAAPAWIDVTTAELADPGMGMGGAWVDHDGNGTLDLHIVNDNQPDLLLSNTFPGFTNIAIGHLADAGAGRCPLWADYDNDGDMDFYLSRDAQANLLLNNDGGVFTDIAAYGTENAMSGHGVSFQDFDGDGLLDLYLVIADAENELFKSVGDPGLGYWVFIPTNNLARESGPGRQAAWADYDLDGDLDIYVVNYLGTNVLYNYDVSMGFVDVTPLSLADTGRGTAAAWGDYDNDGDPDLYLANDNGKDLLFRNDLGSFIAIKGGDLEDVGNARGACWLDYDNDADLDLMITRHAQSNLMLENDGGVFTRKPMLTPAKLENSNCSLFGDYDLDGDLDMYVINEGTNTLLQNNAPADNHWLHIDLVGITSNRSAVGAKLRLVTGTLTQSRELTIGSSGGGQNARTVAFGLGQYATADSLIIDWPSGVQLVFTNVEADKRMIIHEDGTLAGIDDKQPPRNDRISLRNQPNPFNPRTKIVFDLPEAMPARLAIYDLAGRLVKTLLNGEQAVAGYNAVIWDGRDQAGREAASGTYCCRLTAGIRKETIRMVLVR
jgi:ASPIC and UnbV/FG-GAP-like repeat/FlgD Ig-like domain